MVSVRNAILVCIISRMAWDATSYIAYMLDDGDVITHEQVEEVMNAIGDTPDMSITEKLWMDFHMLEPEKYINGATVLCVMLGLNREWFKNVFHVGLIIMSLLYDPVVAIGVYGYIVLTPNQDEHVA